MVSRFHLPAVASRGRPRLLVSMPGDGERRGNALLVIAQRGRRSWSSVRDRSACQRLGRPAAASRDEV